MLLLLAAISGASPLMTSPARRASKCPRTTSIYAFQQGEPLQPRKLGELPDANAYKALYRTVGGCEVPVLVKYNVSGRR
jgi:hypothetical protein